MEDILWAFSGTFLYYYGKPDRIVRLNSKSGGYGFDLWEARFNLHLLNNWESSQWARFSSKLEEQL